MKFLVEFRYSSAQREAFHQAFESSGFSQLAGIQFRDGWVSTADCIAFVLAEATDADTMEQACRQWAKFGQWTIHPVMDLEQL
jgi:hypothetical protein